jgi:hypothetical protein
MAGVRWDVILLTHWAEAISLVRDMDEKFSAGGSREFHLGWPGIEHRTKRLKTSRSSFAVSQSMGRIPLIGILGHLGGT